LTLFRLNIQSINIKYRFDVYFIGRYQIRKFTISVCQQGIKAACWISVQLVEDLGGYSGQKRVSVFQNKNVFPYIETIVVDDVQARTVRWNFGHFTAHYLRDS
jgi:hypothetical protein